MKVTALFVNKMFLGNEMVKNGDFLKQMKYGENGENVDVKMKNSFDIYYSHNPKNLKMSLPYNLYVEITISVTSTNE